MPLIMILVARLLLATITLVFAFGLWVIVPFVYRRFTTPLRRLRGPKGTSWFFGNLGDTRNPDSIMPPFVEWVNQYGPTFKYRGFFSDLRLSTVDLGAINHIITHTNDYQKPPQVRYNLSQFIGEGVLLIEGAQHRQQRHIMNPAFGPAQIRALTDIFLEKAIRLRDILSSEVEKDPARSTIGTHLDIAPWLSRMTLDVIGLAGFNYNFDALNATKKRSELHVALETVFGEQELSLFPILQAWIPLLRLITSTHGHRVKVARETMERVGGDLLADAKVAALSNATDNGAIEKGSLQGRDLLSLLARANVATDIPESQRMSDKDVLAQVPTFLVAGHETISTATAWALFAMMKSPKVQKKLRKELLSVSTDKPSMDELMALPYLDAVVRETLRVFSPIPEVDRVAMKDDVLPVDKPYRDADGILRDSIKIGKGDLVTIPIQAINMSPEIWGPDAGEFRPERWENVPETASHIPGAWSHLMTFLGGPRTCIGFRFSVVELKALLFTLVRAFEFELAVPAGEIDRRWMIVQRPVLRNDPKLKPQLPILLKTYKQT